MRRKILGGEACRVKYVSYKADGAHYHADVSAHPLLDDRGRTTHMVMMQRDVSDVVLRDAQLAMQNERLTSLTSIARGIFGALDPSALVDALVVGAHELVGGEAQLLAALPAGGFGATRDLLVAADARAEIDPFLGVSRR